MVFFSFDDLPIFFPPPPSGVFQFCLSFPFFLYCELLFSIPVFPREKTWLILAMDSCLLFVGFFLFLTVAF